jgi:hypothetical protein
MIIHAQASPANWTPVTNARGASGACRFDRTVLVLTGLVHLSST